MIYVFFGIAYLAIGLILAIAGTISVLIDEDLIMWTITLWPIVLILVLLFFLKEFVVWTSDKLEDWWYSRKREKVQS